MLFYQVTTLDGACLTDTCTVLGPYRLLRGNDQIGFFILIFLILHINPDDNFLSHFDEFGSINPCQCSRLEIIV